MAAIFKNIFRCKPDQCNTTIQSPSLYVEGSLIFRYFKACLFQACFGIPLLQTSFSQQMCSWKVYMEAYFWNLNPSGMCRKVWSSKDFWQHSPKHEESPTCTGSTNCESLDLSQANCPFFWHLWSIRSPFYFHPTPLVFTKWNDMCHNKRNWCNK